MISKITALIMAIISLTSGLSVTNPSRQVLYEDVAYGTHERQVMDICFPENIDDYESVIVFIHGGSWIGGDKSAFHARLKPISKAIGCITVTMNYRFISAQTNCLDILNDIDAMLTKVKSMASTRGATCKKVMFVGFSAGSHLSMLYSYTRSHIAPITPCAVVSYSGPSDLSSDDFINGPLKASPASNIGLLSRLTGVNLAALTRADQKKILFRFSPIKYVSSYTVPTLVVHGRQDELVPINDTYRFINVLNANGVPYKFIEFPSSGHALNNDIYMTARTNAVFVDFANIYLK